MEFSLGHLVALAFILFLVLDLPQRAAPFDSTAPVSKGDWGFACVHLGPPPPRSGVLTVSLGRGGGRSALGDAPLRSGVHLPQLNSSEILTCKETNFFLL